METKHEDCWIAGRLATLEPQWRPDFAHGRNLLEAGLAEPKRSLFWVAAAAASALCVVAFTLPQTRALAEQLWQRLVLGHVDVMRADFSDLPLDVRVAVNGVHKAAQDLDAAARMAGFRPSLPTDGVLSASPTLTVIDTISVEETIDVGEIEAALHKIGATDVVVPREWEGVPLRYQVGPIVSAGYLNDVTILQAQPIELSVPAGFPLERFVEVVLRSIGIAAPEAQTFAKKFVANPAWLLDIPADEVVNIEEVSLPAGPALLIEDFGDQQAIERVTVFRSTSERIYCVVANTRELSLKVAGALP